MNLSIPPISIGWIIALVILVLVVVFFAIGTLPAVLAVLIGGLALARLT